eukprot:CFRG8663
MNKFLANIVQLVQMACITVVVLGDNVFALLGANTPSWYASVKESKIMYVGIVWLIGSYLVANLTTTGAFEVAYADELIWSKKDTGQLPPSVEYLITQVNTRFTK